MWTCGPKLSMSPSTGPVTASVAAIRRIPPGRISLRPWICRPRQRVRASSKAARSWERTTPARTDAAHAQTTAAVPSAARVIVHPSGSNLPAWAVPVSAACVSARNVPPNTAMNASIPRPIAGHERPETRRTVAAPIAATSRPARSCPRSGSKPISTSVAWTPATQPEAIVARVMSAPAASPPITRTASRAWGGLKLDASSKRGRERAGGCAWCRGRL